MVLPDETPIKQDTKTPPPHLPPEAIKPLDAPTPNLDELIGDIGPAPEMKPVVDIGSSTPPSHLPPEAIKPLDAPIQKDAVVLPGETPIK